MGARTGAEYLNGLKDGRDVWLGGERVADVTAHPGLHRAARSVARLYDLQHDPRWRDRLTFPSPESGEPVALSFIMPRTPDDLVRRRRAYEVVASATFGWMGRTPDYVNTQVTACAMACAFFASVEPRFGENIVRYHAYARERDLCLTHTLISPQVDRSTANAELADPYIALGVVRETDRGLIVRGARMLATLAPFADELVVLPGNPLTSTPGDEKYALAFAIPVATPGLRFVCRETFDLERSHFDHPLASRFEEMDAMAIFTDVLVPWNRVFLHGNVEKFNRFFPDTGLFRHYMQQVAVKDVVKCEFLLGLAALMAETIGVDGFPHVQAKLGELVDTVEVVRALLVAAEAGAAPGPGGYLTPAAEPFNTLRDLFPRLYPRAVEIIQLLGAAGLMANPTEADFAGAVGAEIGKYYQGRNTAPEERVALFRLGWDAALSSFGSRQVLYERFFNGDPERLGMARYRTYDRTRATALVRGLLADAEDVLAPV
jgi:4-hydroxyphenylacetate 3-monooxygenase